MATASHEHIQGLSASLSKMHHRAPISDLWGSSVSQKHSSDAPPDFAMDIALETSRGPLMSSASSAVTYDSSADETQTSVEGQKVPVSAGVASTLWPSGPKQMSNQISAQLPAQKGNNPANKGNAQPSASAPPSGLHLRSFASNPPSFRGSAAAGNSVGSMGPFRSGIWGPRQNFNSFNNAVAFSQPPSAGSVYSKTPWSVDLPANPVKGISIGNAEPFYPSMSGALPAVSGTIPNSVAGSIPGSVSGTVTGQVPTSIPKSVPNPVITSGLSASVPNSVAGSTPVLNGSPQTSPSPPSMQGPSRLYARAQPGTPVGQQIVPMPVPQQNNPHLMRNGLDGMLNSHVRLQKKNGRPSTNTELYKTELCASYMSTGGNCPYGEKCQFAHGMDELKSVDRPPKWRSKPCQNWVKTGSCSYNERCCFRHDVPVGHNQQ